MEDLKTTVVDHEGRIRILEKHDSITATKLDITNKILGAIAIMVGGGIVTYIFTLFR